MEFPGRARKLDRKNRGFKAAGVIIERNGSKHFAVLLDSWLKTLVWHLNLIGGSSLRSFAAVTPIQ
jgi:hypothetical protein